MRQHDIQELTCQARRLWVESRTIVRSSMRGGVLNMLIAHPNTCAQRYEAHVWSEGKQVYLGGYGLEVQVGHLSDVVFSAWHPLGTLGLPACASLG